MLCAYSLGSGGSDSIHDGVHVEVALVGGSRTNAHRLVSHLYVDLESNIYSKQHNHCNEIPITFSLSHTLNLKSYIGMTIINTKATTPEFVFT